MTKRSRKHGIIFTITICSYFVGLVVSVVEFNKNLDGNGLVINAVKAANMLVVTVSYFWVMHLLRVGLSKLDQECIKNELDLVKLQQWLIGIILLVQCGSSIGSLCYLTVELIKDETECEEQVFKAMAYTEPWQIVFRAAPSILILISHIKNYRIRQIIEE